MRRRLQIYPNLSKFYVYPSVLVENLNPVSLF